MTGLVAYKAREGRRNVKVMECMRVGSKETRTLRRQQVWVSHLFQDSKTDYKIAAINPHTSNLTDGSREWQVAGNVVLAPPPTLNPPPLHLCKPYWCPPFCSCWGKWKHIAEGQSGRGDDGADAEGMYLE